ncbi:MAG: efflux RND transporter periplasmic adaptor subunit [Mixta calida]|uniref:Efflux RND transporter periplasmic adaptor subunit n=1 Tax=Mixta calida TaxID=665913 RepID=A0ABM6S6A0_9GAMM|nr:MULTISPECIES: efflux RND transporter periplasmic adaptor subunit [Mixta]AIX72964.1 hemolysin secretion protein D [Pantoea sp. PSNIH2]MDU3816620.1 efflux RND transporter periplasmic adaptor subunit [Pantoea sp.]POU50251.1 efflux RND transporter periplasmic adaptor subunit [Pantoea sp. PSNIH5]POU69125.1 efflux RND transporter periplasmic adaptor subunit [Pantoea sp. PSNIH4]POY66372.1 efflux RND transporter periplasmic adaptor subunit [Pantoea sp. PSNIH3]
MALRRTLFSRKGLLLLVLLIVAAVVVWALLRPKQGPAAFLTATVEQRPLQQAVLADGTLSASKLVSVGAQASGQIKRLLVELGDQVKQGQLVAEIDSMTQQNALQNAQAALKNIEAQRAVKEAQLSNYRAAFARQKAMLTKNLTPKADYDDALTTLSATEAEIRALDAQIVQAQIEVNTAQVNLGYTRIVSPIDGTVVSVPVEEGQTVNAVQSAPTLIKVANLDTMTVKAQISEADVINVQPGMKVWFTILGEPNRRYEATLRAIEPAPDSINQDSTSSLTSSSSSASDKKAIYYYGLFDVPNPQHRLRISMSAEVHIVLGERPNALVIPATAIDTIDGKTSVQVVDNQQRVTRREIKVGLNDNVEAEIISGLKVGEKVVLSQRATADATSGSPDHGPGPR